MSILRQRRGLARSTGRVIRGNVLDVPDVYQDGVVTTTEERYEDR